MGRYLEKSLLLRPFPQEAPPGTDMKDFRRRYRDGMVQQAGVCIFIGGLKEDAGTGKRTLIIADGVMEEFESAKRLGRVLIPVGATGGAAAKIWKFIDREFDTLCPFMRRNDFEVLNDARKRPAEIVKAVDRIIEAVEKPRRKRT